MTRQINKNIKYVKIVVVNNDNTTSQVVKFYYRYMYVLFHDLPPALLFSCIQLKDSALQEHLVFSQNPMTRTLLLSLTCQ